MFGYLGPAGTFTHQALLTLTQDEARPFVTVRETLDAVRSKKVEAALVPIENSVEGGVSATLDYLAHGDQLVIISEVLLAVQFGLYVRPGTTNSQVRRVITHPHAGAQTRDWLSRNLPEATITDASSTAAAAAEVARPDSPYDAAVCAEVAGRLYGLVTESPEIADKGSAVTRFVLVARAGQVPPRTGADKTTLVACMRDDHPGALLDILEQFASRGVNLSRIESRPTKTHLGSYLFSIDAEGHLEDARIAETLQGLHRVCKEVIFLGSYPRADREPPVIPSGSSDEDYRKASEWFSRLRG